MPIEKPPQIQNETNAPVDRRIDSATTAHYNNHVVPENNKPTHQDSVDLYLNTKKVEEYYNSQNYKIDPTRPVEKMTHADFSDSAVDYHNKHYLRKSNHNPDSSRVLEDYYKEIDANKYYRHEDENNQVDLNAPMTLYDKRITPQKIKHYVNINRNDEKLYNEQVTILGYDTSAVKPFSMLTETEIQERIRKYGTAGLPETYKNTEASVEEKGKYMIRYKDPKKGQYSSAEMGNNKFDYMYFETEAERDAYWEKYVEPIKVKVNHYSADPEVTMWIPVKMNRGTKQ